MLGDTAKIKELKKTNEKNFGWEQVDVLENVEDISSLDSEDLLPDSLYFKSQIKDLLKYLLEGDYKGNKELKKISNLNRAKHLTIQKLKKILIFTVQIFSSKHW